MKSKKQTLCYSLLPSDVASKAKAISPIIIKLNEPGFYRTDWKWQREYARKACTELNTNMGVTREMEQAMVVGSMFGWSVPGANPKHYQGKKFTLPGE